MLRVFSFFIAILISNIGYTQINDFDDSCKMIPRLIPIKINNKWGYCNKNLEIKIKPVFDKALPFLAIEYPVKIRTTAHRFATVKYNGIYYRIDTLGNRIDRIDIAKATSPHVFSLYSDAKFAITQNTGKYGILSLSKNLMILNPEYDSIVPFDPNLIFYFPYKVKKDGKYGIARQDGKIIIPIIYENIEMEYLYWDEIRLLKVKQNNEEYYIDYCNNEYKYNKVK